MIAKGQTRFDGFDDKILSLYARGMTVREIQGHLAELYGTEVSPDLISRVTDAVLDEVREWQTRPLDPVYPVVFFDALRVKIRDEGMVKNKAVYVALALNPDGEKEVLGPVDRADRRRQILSSNAQSMLLAPARRLTAQGRSVWGDWTHRRLQILKPTLPAV